MGGVRKSVTKRADYKSEAETKTGDKDLGRKGGLQNIKEKWDRSMG